ncbi:MAG TPA: Maf family protein, partial [Gemmatimonadaceae bacterium]|nr:Maf family protein [Gemmatimonadaceae bacterium]
MNITPRVILASSSPRRRELLSLIGIAYEARPADIDESYLPGERPLGHCERLAREKALVIASTDPEAVVIGSDTIVVVDDQVLGKPKDVEDAKRMLRMLSGRAHTVLTGVAVARRGIIASGVESVNVLFRELDDAEIDAYVATREPMDKAGSYGIQGFGATIVARIEGDYFAVMGLALVRMVGLLGEVGIRYESGRLLETSP